MVIDDWDCFFQKFVHKENERNKVIIAKSNKINGRGLNFLFYFLPSRQGYFYMF